MVWNSQYESINQALKLKGRLILFLTDYADQINENDVLTADDWTRLEQLRDHLAPFLEITNIVQSGQGSLWQWIPGMEALYRSLEESMEGYKRRRDTKNPLAICTQAGFEKLDKYYNEADKAYHLYAAATLFMPDLRQHYFDVNWTNELLTYKPKMLSRVRKELKEAYRVEQLAVPEQPTRMPSIFLRQLGKSQDHHKLSKDPLSDYAIAPTTDLHIPKGASVTDAALQWWDKNGHPQLKQYAFDLLAIPATSCDLERVFSDAGNLINPHMSSMKEGTIELRICLASWLKQRLVEITVL